MNIINKYYLNSRLSIEKEMEENLKNALCLIPTDLRTLVSHSQSKYVSVDQQSIPAGTNATKQREEKKDRDGDSQIDSNSR